jgi:SAM-dependent methyltransferase
MTDAVAGYWETFWERRNVIGSQNDLLFQQMSHEKIYDAMKMCDRLLILGCGDGDGIELYGKKVCSVNGIDFSREAIKKATTRFPQHSFCVADITQLDAIQSWTFDAVISERCITNLNTIEKQLGVIKTVNRMLKPGGRFYLCEPTVQGYDEVDRMRLKMGLSTLKRHWHNLLLDEGIVETTGLTLVERHTFGLYTLISRILYPLYIYPEEPSFDDRMNRVAYTMSKELFKYGSMLPSQHTLFVLEKGE